MKKIISYYLLFCLSFVFINGQEDFWIQSFTKEDSIRQNFTKQISKARLKEHLEVLASDSLEGRDVGQIGLMKARNYIVSYYQKELDSTARKEDFLQKINLSGLRTENILLQISGSIYKDEYIIVSAHYDHVGRRGPLIFNGADDNASGSSALLELARVFYKASMQGYQPKRNIIFAHFTAEEKGLVGSKLFVHNKTIPDDKIMANLNVDMIGRVDKAHRKDNRYVYIVGASYFSNELNEILQEVNEETNGLELNYKYNPTNQTEKFFQRTDSFPFSQKGIPFIFFTSGIHDDYHQTTDTADKIDYDALTYRARLLFAMAWELANKEDQLEIDEKKVKNYIRTYGEK